MNSPKSVSVFPPHNIDAMNEDDVAGELVRPLCRALGYSQGDVHANLRSQVQLQYDKAFLGHRDGQRDPVIRGRPDFVCEVVSYARWVVEAKKPSIELTLSDSQQAHTYATHPEIAAEFYMLTNGRQFRLYRVGKPDDPFLAWEKDQTDDMLPVLKGQLGPAAMMRRATVKVDLGKPLAREGEFGSEVRILGGNVVYERNTCSVPVTISMDGLRNPVRGNFVKRRSDGLITAEIDLQSAFQELDSLQRALGFYPLVFNTADEFISSDIENPTLMQNALRVRLERGLEFPKTMMSPGGVVLFDIDVICYTEAVGFFEGDRFKGTFAVDYEYKINVPVGAPIPREIQLRSEGTFDILFA